MESQLKQFVQVGYDNSFEYQTTKTRDGKNVVIVYREPCKTALAFIKDNGKSTQEVGRAEFAFKDNNKTFYLRMIKIDEDFRNQGIGSAMIENLVSYAQQKQCEKMQLVAAKRLLKFYEGFGFTCTGKTATGFAIMDLTQLIKDNKTQL